MFLIQDSDNPMYVIAESWSAAIAKWQRYLSELDDDSDCSKCQPSGVSLLAENDGLIL